MLLNTIFGHCNNMNWIGFHGWFRILNGKKLKINPLAELIDKRIYVKLCILLIFKIKGDQNFLINIDANLYAIFAKLLNIYKQVAGNLVNESHKCQEEEK